MLRKRWPRFEQIRSMVRQRRIPFRIARWMSRDAERSRLWRLARRFCDSPSDFYRRFGFFPLPVQTAPHTAFEYAVYERVEPNAATEPPPAIHDPAEWVRWTTGMPPHLVELDLQSCHIVTVPQGRVDCSGNVFSEDGCLVTGASHPARRNTGSYYLPSHVFPRTYTSDCVVAATSGVQDNYFHWMVDVLPRVHMARGTGGRIYIKTTAPFQRETLSLLGIGVDRIIPAENYPMAAASRLIVPFHEVKRSAFPQWVCDFLRKSILPRIPAAHPADGGRRIYITRRGARIRRVVNEAELLGLLEPLGFQRVELDGRSVVEQAGLFHRAEAIIAPHGAALANLVFCCPGTKVVEIQPHKLQDVFFRLARRMSICYSYLRSSTGPTHPVNNHQDLTVDLEQMRRTLALAGINEPAFSP